MYKIKDIENKNGDIMVKSNKKEILEMFESIDRFKELLIEAIVDTKPYMVQTILEEFME